jgi:hypothetical protein
MPHTEIKTDNSYTEQQLYRSVLRTVDVTEHKASLHVTRAKAVSNPRVSQVSRLQRPWLPTESSTSSTNFTASLKFIENKKPRETQGRSLQ